MSTYTVYLCLLALIIRDVLSCQHSSLTITSHLHPETPVFVSFYIHIMTPPPPPPHNNRFTALFLEPPGWAGARRELLDFMVQGQGKINRGRHTDHPVWCHSIQTNQCPPPPSSHLSHNDRLCKNRNVTLLYKTKWTDQVWHILYILSVSWCGRTQIFGSTASAGRSVQLF